MQCPKCLAALPDDDVYCEACGAPLKATPPPAAGCVCGALADDADEEGFCMQCGRLRRPATDHMEAALSADCAAVTDRGLKHARNEDRFGLQEAGGGFALVVCDGVSSSRESERASSMVAERVTGTLAAALANGAAHDPESAVRRAIAAGESSLTQLPAHDTQDNPPSTTVVAAMVAQGIVTLGWVGDSRAYWIANGTGCQLTSDHSWMNAVVSAGEMTQEEAARNPQAHAITRWLGADAGENSAADTVKFPISAPGYLLLCTDGLWNYAPEAEQLARLVQGADALTAARSLVDFAIAQGGHDNITAIVLRLNLGKTN